MYALVLHLISVALISLVNFSVYCSFWWCHYHAVCHDVIETAPYDHDFFQCSSSSSSTLNPL